MTVAALFGDGAVWAVWKVDASSAVAAGRWVTVIYLVAAGALGWRLLAQPAPPAPDAANSRWPRPVVWAVTYGLLVMMVVTSGDWSATGAVKTNPGFTPAEVVFMATAAVVLWRFRQYTSSGRPTVIVGEGQ